MDTPKEQPAQPPARPAESSLPREKRDASLARDAGSGSEHFPLNPLSTLGPPERQTLCVPSPYLEAFLFARTPQPHGRRRFGPPPHAGPASVSNCTGRECLLSCYIRPDILPKKKCFTTEYIHFTPVLTERFKFQLFYSTVLQIVKNDEPTSTLPF